jgi:hypothetical protein
MTTISSYFKALQRIALVVAVGFFVAATAPAARADGKLDRFWQKLKDYADLAGTVVKMLREYPKKRDELRALRQKACPIDVGYRPDYWQSAAGLVALEQKAESYYRLSQKFVHDGILIERGFIDPQSRQITGFADGLGDAAVVNGRYLTGIAHRFGVTGKPEHLADLVRALTGVYNLMTLAGAPDGFIVNPRTKARYQPAVGLPVRGFGNLASPLVSSMSDLSADHLTVYEYHGSLMGLPKGVYRFSSTISRDQVDGLFLGLSAAWRVLTQHNAAPEWRARIAQIVRDTMLRFVRAGYRYVELDGKTTEFGDNNNNNEPTKLTHNLGWLGFAAAITGDAELKGHYTRLANRYFGRQRLFKAGIYGAAMRAVKPILEKHEELLLYGVSMFNFNLLAQSMHLLVEWAPDPGLRAAYLDIFEQAIWPLFRPRRVPYFDYIYMRAMGRKDPALITRAIGVLGQFRDDPYPFGNPANPNEYVTDFRGRVELRDPLFYYLKEMWQTKLARHFPGYKESPFYAGGGVWALGPGLVNKGDNISGSNPHFLVGEHPTYWHQPYHPGERLIQYAPHDFLQNYWTGRYYGLLGAGAAITVDPPKIEPRTVVQRLVQKLRDFAAKVWDHAKEFVNDTLMRLKSPAKKIRENVVPTAQKLANASHVYLLGLAQSFFDALGPSLRTLAVAQRHELAGAAFASLRGDASAYLQKLRAQGVDKVDGWFSRRERKAGVGAFTNAFDAVANQTLAAMDALYQRKVNAR